MDIIIHNYYNLNKLYNLIFYNMNKNQTLNINKKVFKKDGNNAIYTLNNILYGLCSISLETLIEINISIIINNKIVFNETNSIFCINISEINIVKLNNEYFIKKKYKLKEDISKINNILWNIYWNSLHWLSLNYPVNPDDNDKRQLLELTNKMIDNGISCNICKKHFEIWNNLYPIEENYNSRDDIMKWYQDLHNDINMKNNKKSLQMEQFLDIYKNFDYIEFVKIYKIDIISLFVNRELKNFPDILYNNTLPMLYKEHNINNSSL